MAITDELMRMFGQPGFDMSGAGFSPELGATMTQSPEVVAAAAARAGVPPPPLSSFPQMAAAPPDSTSVGSLFEPRPGGSVPMPQPRPADMTPGEPLDITPPGAVTQPAAGGNRLLETLRGLKAPTPPQAPMVGTPAAPRPQNNIKLGQLMALLMQEQNAGAGGLKLPSTLGAALGGR